MATVNLGSIKFNWKGSYSGATAYVVDDVVESSGSSYICIAATTGNAPPNATYWEQMSAKGTDGTNGTDGTDLTTTLTTQGDIVYRNASGLARLGAGTSGQFLKTQGTGANPTWANLDGSPILQRVYYNFSDGSNNNSTGGWHDAHHPIGDGTLNITPTATGNIIQIQFNFFIGHEDTWQSSTQKVVVSTDGGSSYSNSQTLGNDAGYGGVNNYVPSNNVVGDTHSGILWHVTANTNNHKFKWQYYGSSGGAGFYLNTKETNMAGGVAHSYVILTEYDTSSSAITNGGSL